MTTKQLHNTNSRHLRDGVDKEVIIYCGCEEIGRVTKFQFINIIDARMTIKDCHQTVNTFDDGIDYIEKQFIKFLNNIKKDYE